VNITVKHFFAARAVQSQCSFTVRRLISSRAAMVTPSNPSSNGQEMISVIRKGQAQICDTVMSDMICRFNETSNAIFILAADGPCRALYRTAAMPPSQDLFSNEHRYVSISNKNRDQLRPFCDKQSHAASETGQPLATQSIRSRLRDAGGK
jgi:hypothetical protein